MIERGNKIYIWNELHPIVVVKYKHSSILGRSPTVGMKKFILLLLLNLYYIYIVLREHHILE